MSTRSTIGIYDNGKITAIYCHNDGYIKHNGEILQRFYTTKEDVEELIALGDLSILGKRIGEKVDFNKMAFDPIYRDKYDGQCVAYHRDRGEEFHQRIADDLTIMDESYNYLFRDGKWLVSCHDTDYEFEPLKAIIEMRREVE